MPRFDGKKAYKPEEDVFFNDGREIDLLHYIYERPDIDSVRDSPSRVIACIDEYARTKKYLMNVGEDKGRIVTNLIAEVKPNTMVELGGYVGYSCILFADAVRRAGGHRYYSLERNAEFAAIIGSLIDLAGLSDIAKVVVGSSDKSILRLHAEGRLAQGVDLMFLDHYKPAYTADLKLCEELALIRPGQTVLAADNVIKPGNPPYLEYVRASVSDKRAALEKAKSKGADVDQRFEGRTAQQYGDVEALNVKALGDPTLVYTSELVQSFEPTGTKDGIEITKCIAKE